MSLHPSSVFPPPIEEDQQKNKSQYSDSPSRIRKRQTVADSIQWRAYNVLVRSILINFFLGRNSEFHLASNTVKNPSLDSRFRFLPTTSYRSLLCRLRQNHLFNYVSDNSFAYWNNRCCFGGFSEQFREIRPLLRDRSAAVSLPRTSRLSLVLTCTAFR